MKKILILFLIVFATILVGFWSYKKFFDNKSLDKIETGQAENVDEWKIYSNDKWGYSLRYPGNLFIYCDIYGTDKVAAFFSLKEYKSCPIEITKDTVSHFNIVVADRFDDTGQATNLVEANEFLLGNKIGNVATYHVSDEESLNGENLYHIAELPLGDNKLSIMWISEDRELLDEIINTFSFSPSSN